eukprot:366088-Chlamydomonas_euryale.AAC.3
MPPAPTAAAPPDRRAGIALAGRGLCGVEDDNEAAGAGEGMTDLPSPDPPAAAAAMHRAAVPSTALATPLSPPALPLLLPSGGCHFTAA